MAVITPQEVAEYLGILYLETDKRLADCTNGAIQWTEKRRSLTDSVNLWEDFDVRLGAIMYASLLYQQRAQSQGFPGVDELGTYAEDVGTLMVQIYRLVGSDPVIA